MTRSNPYCFFETDFQGKYQNLPMHVRKNHRVTGPWFRAHVTPQNWGNAVNDLETHLQNVRETAFVLSTSAANSGIHPKENLEMRAITPVGIASIFFGLALAPEETEKLAIAAKQNFPTRVSAPPSIRRLWAQGWSGGTGLTFVNH